jgi:predicted metal-dependent peptidase
MEPNINILPYEEFELIAADLEDKHALFYAFWELGQIVFTDAIETAAVSFNNDGRILQFLFNKTFWDQLTHYDKLFVICHECLHVVFNHGFRAKDSINRQISNVAMDIVVNHTLVNSFGFLRNNITEWQKYCWMETVFPHKAVQKNETFEYYYNILNNELLSMIGASSGGARPQTVDNHDNLPGLRDDPSRNPDEAATSGQDAKNAEEFLNRVGGLLSEEEKQEIHRMVKNQGGQEAGHGYINTAWCAPKTKVPIKMAWKRIFKKWKDLNKHTLADVEQWARYHRRSMLLDKSLILPSEMEDLDGQDNNKIKAWFFLDVSGSCEHLKPRFWKAAKSVPKEFFDLRLFSFSTTVREIDVKNEKIYGGGGTSFSCIENYIQKECAAKNLKYPNVVIVITDGFGNYVKPQFADRWYWFLPEHSIDNYIPKPSKIFKLKDFE